MYYVVYFAEGPMSHDQPTYASVPGIRVYGMMCVRPTTAYHSRKFLYTFLFLILSETYFFKHVSLVVDDFECIVPLLFEECFLRFTFSFHSIQQKQIHRLNRTEYYRCLQGGLFSIPRVS